jgi:phosphomannomutase
MVCKSGKSLSELIREMYERYGRCAMVERDFALTPERKGRILHLLMEEKRLPDFGRAVDHVSYADGCKVYFERDAWVIARPSGTEPRIRVFAEAEDAEEAARLADVMEAFIGIEE